MTLAKIYIPPANKTNLYSYFGIKAAQQFVHCYEGGIIWHTQGSGKSITTVLLAKWILENKADARIIVLTDRTELDKQIKSVFEATGETNNALSWS